MIRYLLAVSLLFPRPGVGQVVTSLKVYETFDSTRTFDTLGQSPMHRRPVKIDLFYPSTQRPTSMPLCYGDLLDQYSRRMDYRVTADSARKVSRELAQVFADYLKIDSADKFMQYRTAVYKDLALPNQRYPLIIYAAGMNGSSWENVVMFDSLCRHGYVVAAVSSVGLFPGFMSTGPDITEQVNDVLFVKEAVSRMPFVDNRRIGLLSWSLGGTAISKVAMVAPEIRCLLSYDGTEIHYYGLDSSWDKEFDEMMRLAPNDPSVVKVPYLYIGSERTPVSKMYNLLDHVTSKDKQVIRIQGAIHEDFSSIVPVAAAIRGDIDGHVQTKHQQIWQQTIRFLDRYVKGGK